MAMTKRKHIAKATIKKKDKMAVRARRAPSRSNVKRAKIARTKVHAAMSKSKEAERINIRKTMPSLSSPEEVASSLNALLQNESAVEFLKKTVSTRAPEVLSLLTTPKTDEYIAETLEMKINAVRRILNLMQGHGITNYYVSKNTNGWLSFAWYINSSKVPPFFDFVNSTLSKKSIVTNDCDDYFVCNSCYSKDNVIFTFDSAYESSFRCACGQKLSRISRGDAESIINEDIKEIGVGKTAGTAVL